MQLQKFLEQYQKITILHKKSMKNFLSACVVVCNVWHQLHKGTRVSCIQTVVEICIYTGLKSLIFRYLKIFV